MSPEHIFIYYSLLNIRHQLAAVAASFRVWIVSLNNILTPNVLQKHILTPYIVKSHSHTLFTDFAFLHRTYSDHILAPYSFWVRCLRESPPMPVSLTLKPLSVCACQAHDHHLVPHIPCATVIIWINARADNCQSKVPQLTPCYFSTLSRFSVSTLKNSNSVATREASINKTLVTVAVESEQTTREVYVRWVQMPVWGVHPIVIKHIHCFVWTYSDTLECAAPRGDDTCWQGASQLICTKAPLFQGV